MAFTPRAVAPIRIDFQKIFDIETQAKEKNFDDINYITNLFLQTELFPSSNKGIAIRCLKVLLLAYDKKFLQPYTIQKVKEVFHKTFTIDATDFPQDGSISGVAISKRILDVEYEYFRALTNKIEWKEFSDSAIKAFRDYVYTRTFSVTATRDLRELVLIAKKIEDVTFESFVWGRIFDLLLYGERSDLRELLELCNEDQERALLEQYAYMTVWGEVACKIRNEKLDRELKAKLEKNAKLSAAVQATRQVQLKELELLQARLDAFTHVCFAERLIQIGEIRRAAIHLEQFLNQKPGSVLALVTLAKIWYMSKDIDKKTLDVAAIRLKRAAVKSPHNIFILYALAQIYYKQNNNPEAQKFCLKILKFQPKHVGAQAILAAILENPDWLNFKDDKEVFYHVAKLYFFDRSFHDAKECFLQSLNGELMRYYYVGKVCFELGQIDQAKRWSLKCLEIDSKDEKAIGLLAEVHNRFGDFQEAIAVAQKLPEESAERAELVSQAHLGARENRIAEAVLEKAYKARPDDSHLVTLLARCYHIQGKVSDASSVITSYKKANTYRSVELLLISARLHLDAGKLRDAEKSIVDALFKDPASAEARELLVSLLSRLRDNLVGHFSASDMSSTNLLGYLGVLLIMRADSEQLREFIDVATAYRNKNGFLTAVLGLIYLEVNRADKAHECHVEVDMTDPNHSYAQILGGKILGLTSYDQGLLRLDAACRIDPENSFAISARADLLATHDEKARSEAEFILKKYLQQIPNDGFLFSSLGLLLWKRQKYAEAKWYLENARSLRPGHVVLFNTLGIGSYTADELNNAKTFFYKALAVNRNNSFSDASLGNIFLQKELKESTSKRHEKMIERFGYALKNSPRNKNMLIEAILLYLDNKNDALGAQNFLNELKKIHPDHASIATMEAVLAFETDKDKAELLLLGSSHDSCACTMLGVLYRKNSRLREAKKMLQEAVKMDKYNLINHALLAATLLEQGSYEAAIASYQVILDAEPANAHALAGIGIARFLHKTDEAITPLEQAKVLLESSVIVAKYLGWAYLHSKQYEKAEAELERAQTLDSQDQTIQTLVDEVKQKLGRKRERPVPEKKHTKKSGKEKAKQKIKERKREFLELTPISLRAILLSYNPWRLSAIEATQPQQRHLLRERGISVDKWTASKGTSSHRRKISLVGPDVTTSSRSRIDSSGSMLALPADKKTVNEDHT
jgi:tetratricopeptide (TPR) repeat protein